MPPTTHHLKHRDRVAFITCTSLALLIVVGMWIWSMMSVVSSGVVGTKALLSDLGETASSARQQVAPEEESVQAVKNGLKELIGPKIAELEQKQEIIGAMAEKIKEGLEVTE